MILRPDERTFGAMRPVKIIPDYTMYAEGSVLIEVGNTKVICTASVDDSVPDFLKDSGLGWVTAEYSMLPRATETRKPRDVQITKPDPRSMEIQRLIGRSLRAVLDQKALGERKIILDCDVIQADGGTRCAAITGGFVALWMACKKLVEEGTIQKMPLKAQVAAVSAGIYEGEPVLDLNYAEDAHAAVDFNIVMTSDGDFVEVQGTGEGRPFTDAELKKVISMGRRGCARLIKIQTKAMEKILGVEDDEEE